MQQRLKPAAGVAGARIVATELFEKLFVPVHNAVSALDPGFGREALPTLARDLETSTGRGACLCVSWHTSVEETPLAGRRIIAIAPGPCERAHERAMLILAV
jgi:hypothetical protein